MPSVNACLCQSPESALYSAKDRSTPVSYCSGGPGAKEAESGRPFVGNSGRLLNKYLQKADILRENAYVTNVIKVRPPGNRKPKTSEVTEALPILVREIELIDPAIIVCLGSIAVQALVDRKAKLRKYAERGWRSTESGSCRPIIRLPYFAMNRKESF